MTSKMEKALTMMLELISSGWEFPDAAYRAASMVSVKQSKLEKFYDEYCLANEQK